MAETVRYFVMDHANGDDDFREVTQEKRRSVGSQEVVAKCDGKVGDDDYWRFDVEFGGAFGGEIAALNRLVQKLYQESDLTFYPMDLHNGEKEKEKEERDYTMFSICCMASICCVLAASLAFGLMLTLGFSILQGVGLGIFCGVLALIAGAYCGEQLGRARNEKERRLARHKEWLASKEASSDDED